MKRFLKRVILFITIPVVLLGVLFVTADPYKVLKPFSLSYFDCTNRDYLSSELFLMNYREQQYDSFIFGSSRANGLNTYHWAKYLPEGSRPFVFQAWGEKITGIEQKITYIDSIGCDIKNVIILIDSSVVFSSNQTPTDAMRIKHPAFSGQPRWKHTLILFYDFIQKPSEWIRSIRGLINRTKPVVTFDVVTNDWNADNKNLDLSVPPVKDSLRGMSEKARAFFIKEIQYKKTNSDIVYSKPLIKERHIGQLKHIKRIFDKHGTDYRIFILPESCKKFVAISPQDAFLLKQIFGSERVFDFSGKNDLTVDYNNFSDPDHFGLYVGWYMIERCYR